MIHVIANVLYLFFSIIVCHFVNVQSQAYSYKTYDYDCINEYVFI